MKSDMPSNELFTRRETLAAGGAVALFTSAGNGAVTQSAKDMGGASGIGSLYYDTTANKLRVNTGGSTWVDLQ